MICDAMTLIGRHYNDIQSTELFCSYTYWYILQPNYFVLFSYFYLSDIDLDTVYVYFQ